MAVDWNGNLKSWINKDSTFTNKSTSNPQKSLLQRQQESAPIVPVSHLYDTTTSTFTQPKVTTPTPKVMTQDEFSKWYESENPIYKMQKEKGFFGGLSSLFDSNLQKQSADFEAQAKIYQDQINEAKAKASGAGSVQEEEAKQGILGKLADKAYSTIGNAMMGGQDGYKDQYGRTITSDNVDLGGPANFATGLIGTGIGLTLNPGGSNVQGGVMNGFGNLSENLAGKAVSKAPTIVQKFVPAMVKSGAEFGALGGMQAAQQGQSNLDIAKNAGLSGLQGMAFGGLTKGLGLGAEGIKSKFNNSLGDTLNTLDQIKKPSDLTLNSENLYTKKGNTITPNLKSETIPTPIKSKIYKPNDEVLLNDNNAAKIISDNGDGTYKAIVSNSKGDIETTVKPKGDYFEQVVTPTTKEQIPMDNRDFQNVGAKNVQAYSYIHPELKNYVQDQAKAMKNELDYSIKGEKIPIKDPHDNSIIGTTGTTRQTSDEIASLLDGTNGYKVGYKDIGKALDNIINDHGAENTALAKKIEILIDDRLSNGYNDSLWGSEIPKNQEYINMKSQIESGKSNIKTSTGSLEPFKTQVGTNTPLKNNALKSPLNVGDTPITNNLGSGEFKTSKLKTNTLENSDFLQQPETQKIVDDIQAQYEVKPNVQSIDRATQSLTKDFNGTVEKIKNSQALNSAEDTTAAGLITRQLRQEASTTGDYTKLKSWLETVQPKVTETAQSLQALNTWKKLSPESALFKIQQVVGKVNREGTKAYGKNFKGVDFTANEMKYVNDAMTKIEAMPSTTPQEIRAKDVEFAKVKQFAANKVPATLAEKVQAIQRISLLLNPKTMGRNIYGNVIMGGLENIKDIPASLTDMAVSKFKTGERTTLMPSLEGLKTQGKGLGKGFMNTLQDARQGVDTNPSRGQYELPNKDIFKGKLGKLEKATSIGLTLGDRPFYQAAYDESLRQSMKIAKVSEPTETMIKNATKMAEDRTYQNVSSLVKGFRNIQKGFNKFTGNENMGIGTFAIPFVKTPANILDKAIDYSPIGSIKAISQLISKKTFDQKLFVDRVGRSLTGSAMIALGYDLASNGLVTGQANKDKDMAALDKQAGKQSYAIKSGDTYHTIDWMQPAAIPLMIGADMYYGGKTKKDTTNVIAEAIKSGGLTLFEQSLLQGVQKLFGGYDPVNGVMSVVGGIPTQFIPGSLSKQVAQLTDNTVRDPYDPNNAKSVVNQITSKIPGLSQMLPAKVDTVGREVKQFNGNNNLYNTFLNPGFTSTYNPSKAEKLATDVYNATGDKGVFPKVADTSITYKDDNGDSKVIQLTPDEKQQLQKYIGQETEKAYSNVSGNIYNSSGAKLLKKLLEDIYTNGENQILVGRGLNAK